MLCLRILPRSRYNRRAPQQTAIRYDNRFDWTASNSGHFLHHLDHIYALHDPAKHHELTVQHFQRLDGDQKARIHHALGVRYHGQHARMACLQYEILFEEFEFRFGGTRRKRTHLQE